MANAKCGACGATQFDLETIGITKQIEPMRAHQFAITVLKCARCGAVLAGMHGSLQMLADRGRH